MKISKFKLISSGETVDETPPTSKGEILGDFG